MKTTGLATASMLLLASCGNSGKPAVTVNQAGSSPASAALEKRGLKALASFVDRQQVTMSTLYGNELARQAALASPHPMPPGATLALLTWQQQADPKWFGARIPGELQSMELLDVGLGSASHPRLRYQRFEGEKLLLLPDTLHQHARIAYLLAQKPSVLP